MSRDINEEVDRLSNAVEGIKVMMRERVDRAGDTASDYAERGGRRFAKVRDRAGRAAHDLSDQASEQLSYGASFLEDTIRDRPLASVGVAFLVGVLLSSTLVGSAAGQAGKRWRGG